MKKAKWIWNILGTTLGIGGAITCIISVRVTSCGLSSNSSSNSTNSTSSASSTSTLAGIIKVRY